MKTNAWSAREVAEFWNNELKHLRHELADFAWPQGATPDQRLEHRWAKLCKIGPDGKRAYKAYTLTPEQTARVEFVLHGLAKVTAQALALVDEVDRLKQELGEGAQGTVDRLIAYLDFDNNKRER